MVAADSLIEHTNFIRNQTNWFHSYNPAIPKTLLFVRLLRPITDAVEHALKRNVAREKRDQNESRQQDSPAPQPPNSLLRHGLQSTPHTTTAAHLHAHLTDLPYHSHLITQELLAMTNSSQRPPAPLRAAPTRPSNSPSSAPVASQLQVQPVPPNPLATSPDNPTAAGATIVITRPTRLRQAPTFNNPRANTPLFGSRNVRDAIFYCKATVMQLKVIIASAPKHLRSHLPSNPTKDILLETVLSLRTEEVVQARLNQRTPNQCLQELMRLTANQLKALATSAPSELAELMRSALKADTQMQPRDIPSAPEYMIITVLTWQVEASKTAHATRDAPPPPPPHPTTH